MVICSFISSDEDTRRQIREIIGAEKFHLLYIDADLEFCKSFKPEFFEGLEEGNNPLAEELIRSFEAPAKADITLLPGQSAISIDEVMQYLADKQIFPAE